MRCKLCQEEAQVWALIGQLKRRAWRRLEERDFVPPIVCLCEECFDRWTTQEGKKTVVTFNRATGRLVIKSTDTIIREARNELPYDVKVFRTKGV